LIVGAGGRALCASRSLARGSATSKITKESVLAFSAVYSSVTLISSDIAKIGIRLVEQDKDGVWTEVNVPAFSPVLKKPNRWQNRIQFFEQWMISKLLSGNTYVLKERDQRGVVIGMYVLDPSKTKPLVAPNGDVYYEIRKDNLSGLEQGHRHDSGH
jgi:HK97 family phage portal protein